jgi:hypothetical protein
MTFDVKRRLILGVAGLIAATLGLIITLSPLAFYSSYGIVVSPQPNLMSELRAPAANLAALGLIILSGALYQKMAQTAAWLGTTVFFAFAAGRLVSLMLDGRPSDSILYALGIEVMLGMMCLWTASKGWQKKAVMHPLLSRKLRT